MTIFELRREIHPRRVLLIYLAILPVVVWFALHVKTNTHDLVTWLPRHTQERADYDEFVNIFGSDESVIVSWPGCSLDDKRLESLQSKLLQDNRFKDFFSSVSSGPLALESLRAANPRLTDSQLKRRLRDVLLGEDQQTTGLVIRFSELGRADRPAALDQLEAAIAEIDRLDGGQVFFAGSPYVLIELDRSTNRTILLAVPAILASVLVCLICLRSLRLTIITFTVAGFATASTLAIITMCGYHVNGLLIITPIFVNTLCLSSGVHLSNYYAMARKSMPHEAAVYQALHHGKRPTVMAMLTTCVGILTLCISNIEAVRQFSLFSSASLLIGLGIVLTLFPAMLLFWPVDRKNGRQAAIDSKDDATPEEAPMPNWQRWLVARPASHLILVLAIGAGFAFGLPRIKSDLAPEKMFAPSHRLSRGYEWMTKNFIPLESVELVIRLPNSKEMAWHRQVDLVRGIQQDVSALPSVASTYGAAQLIPALRIRDSARSLVERNVLDSKIEANRKTLAEEQWLIERNGECAWRVWIGVRGKRNESVSELLASIKAVSSKRLEEASHSTPPLVSGLWPLATTGRNMLFSELASSFLMAFFLITPMIAFMLRGVWRGVIAMIPNMLPAIVFFGSLGWLGINVDVGTLLTASVGMGIAVDDTVHFLQWYSSEIGRGKSCLTAIRNSLRNCSRAMFYTTLITCAGMVFYSFSSFLPARQFALAIIAMLVLALICDLILMPAIILSPLGKLFVQPERPPKSAS